MVGHSTFRKFCGLPDPQLDNGAHDMTHQRRKIYLRRILMTTVSEINKDICKGRSTTWLKATVEIDGEHCKITVKATKAGEEEDTQHLAMVC